MTGFIVCKALAADVDPEAAKIMKQDQDLASSGNRVYDSINGSLVVIAQFNVHSDLKRVVLRVLAAMKQQILSLITGHLQTDREGEKGTSGKTGRD